MAADAQEPPSEPATEQPPAAAAPAASATETARDKPPLPVPTRSIRTIYKVLVAVVGVVSSTTALVFAFAPDLKPTGAAPTQAAQLSDLRVDPDATFGQYLARIDQPRAGYSDAQLRRRGALLDFRIRIEGFRGKTLLLKWELFDDESGREVNESRAIEITPTNPTNEATWQFWVPLPNDSRRYLAIVELLEEKEHHLLKLASLEAADLRGLG